MISTHIKAIIRSGKEPSGTGAPPIKVGKAAGLEATSA